MIKTCKAFTLIEILIAISLVGLIAAFGIPSFNRARERADERDAVANLRIISEALEAYKVRNGDYPAANLPEIADINATLNLGIIEMNNDYDCDHAAIFTCTARNTAGGWDVHSEKSWNLGEVHCGGGTCPTCSGGCP